MKIIKLLKISMASVKAHCSVCGFEYDDGYCVKCPSCGNDLE